MDKPIKRIALYARVSTIGQEEEGTIETQIAAIEEYARDHGYIVVDRYFDNGWSGDTLERPEIDRLRLGIKEADFDAVLAYDRDRIARRYSYQEIIIDEISEAGKQMLFVTTALPKNAEDKILFGVKGLFAEYERVKIAERMRIGKLRKVRSGVMILSEAPYGYTYIPKQGKTVDGQIIINEQEAEIVKKIFSWAAYENYTIKKIIVRLKNENLLPRRSKRGHWANSTLNRLLKKTCYKGDGTWNASIAVVPKRPMKQLKYRKIKKTSRALKPQNEWVNVPFPRIVDDVTFSKAQEQLKRNSDLVQRNKVNNYLLSGLIYCNCGRRRAGDPATHTVHRYYRCCDRVLSHPLPRTCHEGSINVAVGDGVVWNRLMEVMTDETLLTQQLDRWVNKNKNADRTNQPIIVRNEEEIKKVQQKIDRAEMGFTEGAFGIEALKKLTLPLQKRKAELEIRNQGLLVEDQKRQEEVIKLPSTESLQTLVQQVKTGLSNLDFETKKSIINKIIQKVVGNKEKLVVTGFIPQNLLNSINKNYESKTEYRDSGFAQCGEEYAF